MKSIIIAGVRCTLESSKKLCLELPAGMNGVQLSKWQAKHKADALEALESCEETEDPNSHLRA